MSLFDCKICKEKDSHIESLKKQVSLLEKFVFPQKREQILSDIDSNEQDLIEAGRILSGEFDRQEEY